MPLVAAVLATWRAVDALGGDSSVQYCDGERMGPGDSCIVTGGGTSGSYEELVARTEITNAVTVAFGAVVAALAILVLVAAVVAWRLDVPVRARLESDAPLVLGASRAAGSDPWVLGLAFACFVVTGFVGSNIVADGWSTSAFIIFVPAAAAVYPLVLSWPRRGAMLSVGADGVAAIVVAGRQTDVPLRALSVRPPKRQGAMPTLWNGDSKVLTLDKRMLGRDDLIRAVAGRRVGARP